MMEPYDIWQLQKYGNILGKEANLYADEDHDAWKEIQNIGQYEEHLGYNREFD